MTLIAGLATIYTFIESHILVLSGLTAWRFLFVVSLVTFVGLLILQFVWWLKAKFQRLETELQKQWETTAGQFRKTNADVADLNIRVEGIKTKLRQSSS